MSKPLTIDNYSFHFYDNDTLQEINSMCSPDAFIRPVAVIRLTLSGKDFAIKTPIIVKRVTYGYYRRTLLEWLFHKECREAKRDEFDLEGTAEDLIERATKYNLTLKEGK